MASQPCSPPTGRGRCWLIWLWKPATPTGARRWLGCCGPTVPNQRRAGTSASRWRARRAIGDQRADPPFLLISAKTVQFNAPAADLDVARFEALLARCAAHLHADLSGCASCVERLECAAELYRGEFLHGLFLSGSQPFEEWALFKQEQLHRQALTLFERLTRHFLRQSAYEGAERYARRQLALEPWREEAHAQLMQVLALSGRPHAALVQFVTCSRLLTEHLGVAPSDATVQLFERIRHGRVGIPSPRPGAKGPLQALPDPCHHPPRQTVPPVERVEEVARKARGGRPDHDPASGAHSDTQIYRHVGDMVLANRLREASPTGWPPAGTGPSPWGQHDWN